MMTFDSPLVWTFAVFLAGVGMPKTLSATAYGLTFFDQGSTSQSAGTAQNAPGTNVQNLQQLTLF